MIEVLDRLGRYGMEHDALRNADHGPGPTKRAFCIVVLGNPSGATKVGVFGALTINVRCAVIGGAKRDFSRRCHCGHLLSWVVRLFVALSGVGIPQPVALETMPDRGRTFSGVPIAAT